MELKPSAELQEWNDVGIRSAVLGPESKFAYWCDRAMMERA